MSYLFNKRRFTRKHNWKGNLNLVNIVMIGLTNALPQRHNEYVLHRLLCAMFSNELSQQQKIENYGTGISYSKWKKVLKGRK